ncbi:phosphodiester glycosidase family protein [Lacinutrix chionoecetis]
MKNVVFIIFLTFFGCKSKQAEIYTVDSNFFLKHVVDLKTQELKFFLKDKNNTNFSNFESLKNELEKENKNLIFATNGGMFNNNFQPQGLYVENGKILKPLDTMRSGYGNFYLQPNGVFSITKSNTPLITMSKYYEHSNEIKYATQSGPLLLINGEIHPAFNKDSKNLNIRNGVGILPNGNLLFAMSVSKVNFYDFATFFKQNGCKNALYLDGFVSKTYLPKAGYHSLEGNFGVIIAEIK